MMTADELRGLAFDDPETWGYCGICAFVCTVDPSVGLLVEHRRIRNGGVDDICSGSLLIPIDEVPEVASALKPISLKKDRSRALSRSYWQRKRRVERDWARARATVEARGESDGTDDND